MLACQPSCAGCNGHGTSDYSWFSLNWHKYADDPTIVYPPVAAVTLSAAAGANPPAINVELVPVSTPGASDTLDALPSPLGQVNGVGKPFYVEIWVKSVDAAPAGITGGYIDIEFDASKLTGESVNHGGVYVNLTDGSVDNASGLVNDLGGNAPPGETDLGDDEWVRFGYVAFTTKAEGTASFTAKPAIDQFARAGEGGIPWEDVELNNPHISVTVDNVAPSLASLSITSPVIVGDEVILSGQILDPGTQDGLNLEVDWGDGSLLEAFQYQAGTTGFSEKHRYDSLGMHNLEVSVEDDDGGSDQNTAMVVVVTQILGPVDHWEGALDASGGEIWVALETTHDGILTIGTPDSDAQLQLLDNQGARLDEGQRMDYTVGAGETCYFILTGTSADVEVYVCNLVSVTGSSVAVHGTDEADQFNYAPTGSHQVVINGVEYHFEDAEVSSVQFNGGLGDNTATLEGSSADETLTVHPNSATFQRPGVQVQVADTVRVVANGGGGRDIGNLYGGDGPDTYTGTEAYGRLVGEGFFERASGFAELYVYLEDGDDIARLYDSPRDDTFTADPYQATFTIPTVTHHVERFRELHAFASDGNDSARLADDPAEQSYAVTFQTVAGTEAKLFDGDRHGSPDEVNQIFLIRTSGFESVTATAGAGDTALLYGTGGDEHYVGTATQGSLTAPSGAVFTAASFEQIHSVAKSGQNDTAELIGSSEKERFWATRVYGRLGGSGWMHRAVRYDQVTVSGGGGPDVAEMFDTRYRDTFSGWPDECVYQAGRFEYLLQDFPVLRVNGEEAGSDMSHLYPGPDNTVKERTDDWVMSGDGYSIVVEKTFGEVLVHDDSGSGSPSALAGPDEFSPQLVSDGDLAILADASLRGRSSEDQDDHTETAVDSVLRTEFWWNRE